MVRRVVIIPMCAMLFILLITILVSANVIFSTQQKLVESYQNTNRIVLNRVAMRLEQIDLEFVDYWVNDTNHARLNSMSAQTPKENYVTFRAGNLNFMKRCTYINPEIEGICSYYRELDLYQAYGRTNRTNVEMNRFVRKTLEDGDAPLNCWLLRQSTGGTYLYTIKAYANYLGGVWIALPDIMESAGWDPDTPGNVYFYDGSTYIMPDGMDLSDAELVQMQDRQFMRIRSRFYIHSLTDIPDSNLQIGMLVPVSALMSRRFALLGILLALLVLSIAAVPVTASWLRRKIAQPVKALDFGFRHLGAGDLDYRIPEPENPMEDEFDYLVDQFNQMSDKLNDLEYSLYISTIREQQTQLKYISQQIRPHFILNALNIIYTYDESEFPLIRKMVLHLSQYFRYIVNLKVDFVDAQEELRHIENYLAIQKERYLDKLDYEVRWDDDIATVQMPPLIIQSFVENSIKYGMNPEGITVIRVTASREGAHMRLSVSDNGPGMPQKVLDKLEAFMQTREEQEGLGVGLQNAVERMDMLYHTRIEARFYNQPEGGAVSEVFIPLTPPEQEEGWE